MSLPKYENPPPPPMRRLSEPELEMVETMAGTGFSPEEIAEVLMVDRGSFFIAYENKEHIVYRRFRKGFLEQSLKLRQRIFKDAGNGSSPAQMMAKKILDEAVYKNGLSDEQ